MKISPNYYLPATNKGTLITVSDIEFLKARKKRTRDCIEDWQSYDSLVLKRHIEKKGCVAPYHGSFYSFPRCRNKTEMKSYLYYYEEAKENYYPPACGRISKIDWKATKLFIANGRVSTFIIKYTNQWMKIIEQSKEVDVHSLIGNIGGYVGLFLGNKNHFEKCYCIPL